MRRVAYASLFVLLWVSANLYVIGGEGPRTLPQILLGFWPNWVVLTGLVASWVRPPRTFLRRYGSEARTRAGLLAGTAVLGILTICTGLHGVRHGRASTGWPTTSAQLVHADLSHDEGWYSVEVRYAYVVDGRPYESTRISFGGPFDREQYQADVFQRRQIMGARLQEIRAASLVAHYNPDNPWIAVLEPGLQVGAFWTLALGVAFLFGLIRGLAVLASDL